MAEDDGRSPKRWWLHVVHHDRPRFIGRSILVDDPVEIGRKGTTFGEGVLDDGALSRAHAQLELGSGGTPTLRDLDSRNGTFVNGSRVREHPLVSGDVIGLGRILLMPVREPKPPVHAATELVGASHAFCATLATLEKAARRGPTLLWGESGVGKDALARRLHESSARSGPLHVLRCGGLPPERAADTMHAMLDGARDGTLILDTVEELPSSAQLVLLDRLDADDLGGAHIVACTIEPPDGLAARLRPELVNRLRRWSIRVPSLSERRTDIPRLAIAFARRYVEGDDVRLDPELSFRLLRHRWGGNLHELEAVIERAAVESEDAVLRPFDGLDALLAQHASTRMISTYGRTVDPEPFVVDGLGRWFTTPGGQKYDLERRKTLARVLATLITARQESPGRALSVADLLDRAWAEEKLLPRAGANRVYVAVTTLRKMGLKDLLVRTDAGYVLDAEVPLRVIES